MNDTMRASALARLQEFRQAVYTCFGRAADALFNIIDALIDSPHTESFPELTLSPHFQRKWASLYEALEDGEIDQKKLQEIFIKYLPKSSLGERRLILGIDATGIERPFSETSPERT